MEEYLEGFIECIKEDKNSINTETALLVINAFQQNLTIDEFSSSIDNSLRTKLTGIFLCDFEHSSIDTIIANITSHGGIYKSFISCTTELEDNEIYAVFPTPIYAYQCLRQIKSRRRHSC